MQRPFAIVTACVAAFILGTVFQNGIVNSRGIAASAAMSSGSPIVIHIPDEFRGSLVQLAPGVRGKWLAGNSQAVAGSAEISSVKPHRHNATSHFFYVLDGSARVTLGPRTAIVKPGDFVYVPNGVVHSIQSIGERVRLLAVHVPPIGANDNHYVK